MGKNTARKEKEEKKEEEKKSDGSADMKKTEIIKDGKENKEAKENPSAPQEIMLKVYMHCEGCAREVRRSLKGFEGVEEMLTDCRTSKVVVKGKKADPAKVLRRVQRKSHRQVELLPPIPPAPAPEEKKVEEKENPKPEKEKEEVYPSDYYSCSASSKCIARLVLRKKSENEGEKEKENTKEKKGDTEGTNEAAIGESKVLELKRIEYYNYPQTYSMEMKHAYPPQMFSDENPNACSVM